VQQLREELETQRAACAADKRSLELELASKQRDLARETREKQAVTAALKAKSDENEELMLALARARHDAQAQVETFRLKLALFQRSGSSGEPHSREAGAGILALRELLASYQAREKDLRDELDGARNASLRLARRLRDPGQVSPEPLLNNDSEKQDGEAPQTSDDEPLRERLAALAQQLSSEMEQRSEQALMLAELEAQNTRLLQEQQARQQEQNAPARDGGGVRAIAEMHAALTRQLEEVRRLTLQQQQQQQQQWPRAADPAAPSVSADPNELETLRAAKTQLETRLSSTKAQWMALLEQVERRCAELLTKNVMLTEDNENLRKHLTRAHMKPSRS
jgi:hypothetical protein